MSEPGVISDQQIVSSAAKNILVVDDQENNYVVLKRPLKKSGYNSIYASSGEAALAILKNEKIDLILLDWMMPGMSGIEVCKQIKQNPSLRIIPVIMMTARSAKEDVQEGLDAGANDYIIKPIIISESLARVRSVLRTYDLQIQLDAQLKGIAEIQKNLLPSELPHSDGFDIDVCYKPCDDSGGDYYDVFKIDEDHTAFVVADVTGHGAPAMVGMALTRTFLKSAASQEKSPANVLSILNDLLLKHFPTNQFITMFFAVYNQKSRVLTYSTAGHAPPFCYHKASLKKLAIQPGLPLKIIDQESDYKNSEIKIETGMSLFFYTDGFDEAANEEGTRMGADKAQEIVEKAMHERDPVAAIVAEWEHYMGTRPPTDDLTLLYVNFK